MRFFLLIIISINIASADCMGDVNFDNSIDTEDIIIMVQHILHINTMDTISFGNADINGSATVDIYALARLIDLIMDFPEEECDGFTPIDLSLEWETEQDLTYFDSEALDEVIMEDIGQMTSIRGIIVIHQGKIVAEEYFNNSSVSQTYNIWSVTKSYISTLVGQAIDQEYIENQYIDYIYIYIYTINTFIVYIQSIY